MNNKTELRTIAKNIRQNLDIDTISTQIITNIRAMTIYQNASHIMIYYPIKNEINLLPLLTDKKTFFIPRITGEEIECCEFKENNKLTISKFKIPEPSSKCPPADPQILDLIIVPALAANRHGYRLGYGKGFYDRFLKTVRAKTILAIPEELIFDNIHEEEHDVACDIVITQKKASFERG